MIAKTFKTKLKSLTILALVLITILQSAVPAFADNNSGSKPSPSEGKNTSGTPAYSGRMNLAVMLHDGEHKEFILDRDKLTASVKPETYGSFPTQEWANEFNENYVGMSLNRAYSQIFRRTNVSWNAAGASESLLLMGGDKNWDLGGVRIGAEGSLKKDKQYINAHMVKLGAQSDWSLNSSQQGRHLNGWGYVTPRPNGLYKEKLKTYLNAYFKDPEGTTPKPDVFIRDLVDNATAVEKNVSKEIWEYITTGAQVAHKKANPAEAPGERWRKIFESSPNRFKGDEVFIGKGYLYEGDNKRIGSWDDDPRVAEQVVSYLDTLLSLSVLSDLAGLSTVKGHYKQAAMDVFGKPGAYATKPQQMEQKKTIIIDLWTTEAFSQGTKQNGANIGTYTEFWAAYRETYKGDSLKGDWRSLSQFNDFATQPLASKSKAGELWKSAIPETTDRIAQRAFLLDPSNPSRYVNNTDLDVSVGGIFLSGRSMYGASGASLGAYRGDKPETTVGPNKISPGLKYNSSGPFLGLDESLTSDVAGGQFAIYMFAHATPTPEASPFVHNIYATPKDLVVPRRATLDQDVSILYKVGNKYDKSSSNTTVDQRLLDDFVVLFESHATDTKYSSVELQTRTYMTKKITHYKLDTLWLPSSGKSEVVHTPTLGANFVGAEEDLPSVTTAFETLTVPKATFSNFNDDTSWSVITTDKLKNLMLNQKSLLIDIKDDSFRDMPWDINPTPEVIIRDSGGTIDYNYPGYAFYLRVRYEANTEFRIKMIENGVASYVPVDYTGNETDPSVTKYTSTYPIDKVPAFLCKTIKDIYEPTTDAASFKYREEPRHIPQDKSIDFVKDPMPFAVYSSSPKAYAELKNWGVSSYNEPNDDTHLGDDRSPVDEELGVNYPSNGSSFISEDYEAMAGVPTTEKLYLAVGGSEFIIDLAVQYVPNETAVRTYHSTFSGVKNQFNYASPSGAGGDTPEAVLFADFPTNSSVGASISGSVDHTGGTITYTYNDEISASGSAEQTGGAGSASGDWMSLSVESPGICGDTTTGHVETVPDAGDVQKFNDTMTDIENWIAEMSTWISGLEHTSGSDKVSRKIGNGELGEFSFIRNENSGDQAASGSFSVKPPTNQLWNVDDGTETKFDLVTFSGGSYSVTNPRNLDASASSSHIIVGDPPAHTGDNPGSGGDGQGPSPWSVTLSFTIRPHVICGPDCGHTLPAINDIWQQSFNYDYLKIIGLSVLRLDQGSANDSTNTGLNALIGTNKLGVTRQTYFSSPSMSIAQANIFNYMGLQTDGKQDVSKATNEYFRSIAYGLRANGTPETYGNTKTSEAKRVQYFMTNSDGKVLSAKGPDGTKYPKYTNEGNKENKVSFSNEIKTSWGSLTQGIVNAGDYVDYNFGTRSNLSDGTSRGYQYNMNKSSWVENKNGTWRGKAAYDLPWAKGFIYDGVKMNGVIDATGFSVSRSLRNSTRGSDMGGIAQNGTKGWQGTGMSTTTVSYLTQAYEEPFTSEFYLGQKADSLNNPLSNPALRDWGKANRVKYSDTRNLISPGGTTMPGAEKGDWSPKEAMAKLWTDNGVDRSNDLFAQSQPFNTDEMLRAFTNTANDGGTKIRATSEYKLMEAKRNELVQATVLSDALVLDLPNGLQPIIYHYKNASAPAKAHERIPDTRNSFDELWLSNPFSPNGWSSTARGTAKDGIIIGSYNGDLTNPRITDSDLQHRLRARADKVPTTPNMLLTPKNSTIEAPTGVIGKEFGVILLNGTNINRHLGFNDLDTRVLSEPVDNKHPIGTPINHTLLYNVAPIVLSADNREYDTGEAEVFWETIVQWKDTSNHDYYGMYVTGDAKGDLVPSFYLPSTHFVRHPELLGNYGQKERAEDVHTLEYGVEEMEEYFIDAHKLEAYGAEEARGVQAEQFANGFGVTGYNYDTTNKVLLAGKTNSNMYNPSANLTGLAKGTPYITESNSKIKLGVPYILQGILDTAGKEANPLFNTDTALKTASAKLIGPSGANMIPKTGYIQRAAYTTTDARTDKYRLNNIVIHNVISARATQIMPIAEWRDQRTFGQSLVGPHRDERRLGAPGSIEYAVLDCKYDKPLELLDLNLIGSGNSVPNNAQHQVTTGNILLGSAGSLTSTGLALHGARLGISLKNMDAEYYKGLDYQITSKITYSPNKGEQMLFGFQGYGITLDTATKKLFIRKTGTTAYVEVAGTFSSGDTLKVQLGSSNASLSKVSVNGEKRVVFLRSGEFKDLSIGSNLIGKNFYIGSWNLPTYTPDSTLRYETVLFERLAGSHEHTAICEIDGCTEPHHKGGHYENDWLCYSPDLNDNASDSNFVQNSKVNTKAAEFVSLDWDYTLYADSIDNLRSSTAYQLGATNSRTGMGYYDTNSNGEFDDVRLVRGKYVKFPWYALYDGVLYPPGDWVVLGDRGTYAKDFAGDKAEGFGGSFQTAGAGDLFHGQHLPYNVQNWSLYDQEIYHDLYKSFYDFYVPLMNDELSLAAVDYAVVTVNASDDRGLENIAGHKVLSATADLGKWLRGGIVNNRVREYNTAEVGAAKRFYVDLVGRIGGFVLQDTTDVKYSDTFKKPLTPEEATTTVYTADPLSPNSLVLSGSITTGGKVINASDGLPPRVKLNASNDWVAIPDYEGGNARKYTITIEGNALNAGELIVNVQDKSNGAYTLQLADMNVNKKDNNTWEVNINVKETTSSVTITPIFTIIDTSMPNVYVTSMSLALGGAGFGQGLTKIVDATKQNFYVTDLTDVRGVFIGSAKTTDRATEGHGDLEWYRYQDFTTKATNLGDWLRMSDATQIREIASGETHYKSGRRTPDYGTRAVETYGTRPWVQVDDPLYLALAGAGGKAIIGPLTSNHNVIKQYQRPQDQLSVGSHVFFDITTTGNYFTTNSNMTIIPTYYLVDPTKTDANGAVALIPVDVYQFSSSGTYQPVNIFGAPYGGFTPQDLDKFNQYRLNLNWDEEAVGDMNRRMVSNEEKTATQTYADLFTDNIYDENPYDEEGPYDDFTDYEVIGQTESPRKVPNGVMPLGGSQYIYQDYRTQTFIGSNYTYGVEKSGGNFAVENPEQYWNYIYWQVPAQRWHTTLGLPSDAIFVPLEQDPVSKKFVHVDKKDIVANAVDITENLIIGYIDTYAEGKLWTLHYGHQGLQRYLSLTDATYKLPITGPAGPAMANPYPGQGAVGTDFFNGGIPFVLFGGSKVEGQAEIIKTN